MCIHMRINIKTIYVKRIIVLGEFHFTVWKGYVASRLYFRTAVEARKIASNGKIFSLSHI